MQPLVLLNAPNVISLSRLLLAALFAATDHTQIRLALLLLAGGSDALDGWLARRTGTTSRAGALIDAIGDRGFVFVAVAVLFRDSLLTGGEALLLLSRDIATAIGFLVARIIPWLRRAMFKARAIGKVVTMLQFTTLVLLFTFPAYVRPMLLVVGVASLLAIADYTLALWRARTR